MRPDIETGQMLPRGTTHVVQYIPADRTKRARNVCCQSFEDAESALVEVIEAGSLRASILEVTDRTDWAHQFESEREDSRVWSDHLREVGAEPSW